MIVAFMGNDGSGKTTIIKLLQDKLARQGLESIYVPGYDHLLLGYLKKFYQKVMKRNIQKLQEEYDSSSRNTTYALFYLWPYLVFVDCVFILLKYWLKPNRIILFDRYPYDYVVSFQNLGICTKLVRYLFLMLPKPKHSFVFDTSAEIAYERKKYDHKGNIEYYHTQRQRYLSLAEKKKIPVINTNYNTPEQISQTILTQLLTSR